MNGPDRPSAEFRREYDALVGKVAVLEQQLKAAQARRRPLARGVVVACLVLGTLCIGSTIAKSWFGQVSALDWGILLVGVVLCAVSLFKEFTLGKDGLKVKVADLAALVDQVKALSRLLH